MHVQYGKQTIDLSIYKFIRILYGITFTGHESPVINVSETLYACSVMCTKYDHKNADYYNRTLRDRLVDNIVIVYNVVHAGAQPRLKS